MRVQILGPRSTRTGFNGAAVEAYNRATGTAMDTPEAVAAALLQLIESEAAERFLGFPERLAVRLNGVLGALLDGSFARHRRSVPAASLHPDTERKSHMNNVARRPAGPAVPHCATGRLWRRRSTMPSPNCSATGRSSATRRRPPNARSASNRWPPRRTRSARAFPGRSEPLVWEGIVVSSWAGEKGGLGALGLVKQAKAIYEQAIQIDGKALDGSAYNSLGVLYYKVPGWPLGFGDKDKARELLHKALAINPQGIDANYFYAEYLVETKHADEAVPYLERALQAPSRPGRQIADTGRREEVRAMLAKIKAN